MRKLKEKFWVFLTVLLLIIDQFLKIMVRTLLSYQEKISLLPGFFSVTYVLNEGGAFSILNGMNILFILFSLGVIFYLLCYCLREKTPVHIKNIFSLILAGAIGNLVDRICFQKVTDYLSFQFGTYYFPVFNFADICIVLGVFMIFILEFRRNKNEC